VLPVIGKLAIIELERPGTMIEGEARRQAGGSDASQGKWRGMIGAAHQAVARARQAIGLRPGRHHGEDRLITGACCDLGGHNTSSADAFLSPGKRLKLPVVDIVEVGAGGGAARSAPGSTRGGLPVGTGVGRPADTGRCATGSRGGAWPTVTEPDC